MISLVFCLFHYRTRLRWKTSSAGPLKYVMRLIAEAPERLDRFLARMLPEHSRSKLARLIDAGGVRVDGRDRKASFSLDAGMQVEIGDVPETPAHDLTPADIALDVRFEDDCMLVVNTPSSRQ
jgi:23S rRNA pseudouridine1911/1915/1917 synthase